MKREPWMTTSGLESGERAERLAKMQLAARSPAEKFADELLMPLASLALLAGGLLGSVFASDDVGRLTLSYLPDAGIPLTWVLSHIGGLVVGSLAAFLIVDVPTFLGVSLLRRLRPDLFLRDARADRS